MQLPHRAQLQPGRHVRAVVRHDNSIALQCTVPKDLPHSGTRLPTRFSAS